MSCPVCGTDHLPSTGRGKPAASGPTCPYRDLAYPVLRAAHDQLYFGRWRSMDATPIDVRKALRRLTALLGEIARELEKEHLPAARNDLEKALESIRMADPGDCGPETLLHMDHALSYAHRVIGDLLHERGVRPHSPADFADWYDAAEVPFRDEW